MKRITLFIFISYILQPIAFAETTVWDLNRCVKRAIDYNLNFKQTKNREQISHIDLSKAKWELAPTLNARSNGTLNLRRSTNQNNQISSGQTYNMNYGLYASFSLFDGFETLNRIAAMRFNALACNATTLQAQNNLYIDVLSFYSRCLYFKDLLKIATERLQISVREKEKMETLFELGLRSQTNLNEVEAILSENRFQLLKAENNYRAMKLQLAQLLELEDSGAFEIDENEFQLTEPAESKLSTDEVYAAASATYPAIKEKEYMLAYDRKMLYAKRAALFPTVHLNAGYASAYYSTDVLSDGRTTAFQDQYNKYLNPYLGFSLAIPILNGRSRYYEVRKGKIELENSGLELENEKNQIRKEIQDAIQRLNATYLEYLYAADNLKAATKIFSDYQERFLLGLITSIEFNLAQNQLSEARIALVSAKYNWIVQQKTIEMYRGQKF